MSLPVQVKQYISMFGKYDMLYTVSDGSYTVRVLFQKSIQY